MFTYQSFQQTCQVAPRGGYNYCFYSEMFVFTSLRSLTYMLSWLALEISSFHLQGLQLPTRILCTPSQNCHYADDTQLYVTFETSSLKVLGTKISFSIFLHFRVEYDLLTHVTKFQSFTAIGSIFFFSFLFEISRPPLLGLVPEVKAQITGSDVIGSTRKIPHG